jgi:endonuclease III
MRTRSLRIPALLDQLEAFHGPQQPCWPVDPYSFLIWWHCGYPSSDVRCTRGWEALNHRIGIEPRQLLAASQAHLAAALTPGGMVPQLRAMRIHEIAARVENEFGGDLRAAFAGPVNELRKKLKKFPGISEPGVDRILLFSRTAPVAAVPSNCPHVLVRIMLGLERENYNVTYREAQNLIKAEMPENIEARQRTYLLLKAHGQQICMRKPHCDLCPVHPECAYFSGNDRGGSR